MSMANFRWVLPRYMNGAGTNPDLHAYAYAAAQVKKAMDVTKKLGGENYVFWGCVPPLGLGSCARPSRSVRISCVVPYQRP